MISLVIRVRRSLRDEGGKKNGDNSWDLHGKAIDDLCAVGRRRRSPGGEERREREKRLYKRREVLLIYLNLLWLLAGAGK